MTASDRGGRRAERWRMPLRVAAIVAGYVVYRLVEDEHLGGAAFLGAGVVVLSFGLVDRWTVPARERLRLLDTGKVLLALGLVGLGTYLLLRD